MKSLAGDYPRWPAPQHSPPRRFNGAQDRELPCCAHHTGASKHHGPDT